MTAGGPGTAAGALLAVEIVRAVGDADPVALVYSAHRVAAGTTIRQLLEAIGDAGLVAALAGRRLGLARHGRRAWLDDVLVDGDRVEIVRPIVADARAARFRRVAEDRRRR